MLPSSLLPPDTVTSFVFHELLLSGRLEQVLCGLSLVHLDELEWQMPQLDRALHWPGFLIVDALATAAANGAPGGAAR